MFRTEKTRRGGNRLDIDGSDMGVVNTNLREDSIKSDISELNYPPKSASKKNRLWSVMDDDDDRMRGLDPKQKMASSKEMNKEPRRHSSEWEKIRRNKGKFKYSSNN